MQHQAFRRVAAELGIDPPSALPPLREQLADLESLLASGVTIFVARTSSEQVVGGVRGTPCEGRVEIGRLVVADSWVRRGVATALMDALEAYHATASRYTLFTGLDAHAPLALYRSRGYTEFDRDGSGPVVLVWLEKYPDCHD